MLIFIMMGKINIGLIIGVLLKKIYPRRINVKAQLLLIRIFLNFRLIWSWDEGVKLTEEQSVNPDFNKLQAGHMLNLIQQKM